ncbi:HDIG domain-containing protein [Candidatus Woesearchaeota archaeon]|jgi:putative nucleotidyltransferase with HDIG domain|nr:HDIG domain-containing protein [Candidatus Woesearchaeota archaeon]MBT6518684.1 HDIG domain-containing protein [Candidatus Woesearchaeota archaeon]MBT7368873.1 HDIG domain-containing protein [Candidatus Woesearchaeota archaeon]
MLIPTEKECFEILKKSGSESLKDHSMRVMKIAVAVAKKLINKGIEVDIPLVTAAALLHDVKKLDANICHAKEGGEFLRKNGMSKVASIVEKHALCNLNDSRFVPLTIEEKIVLYADLRANPGKVVSLEARFEYIKETYPTADEELKKLYNFAKDIEIELIGEDTELGIELEIQDTKKGE